jgi:HSP20 family molecular chaperone IbpA
MPTTLARWRDSVFAPFEAGAGLFPFVAPEIRVEQVMEDGRYVIRAEVPGVDPAKDIDVTVKDGTLTIRAERTEEKRDKAHSEFHYGRLVRMLPLPMAVLEESAEAIYDNGILQITFAVGEPRESAHHIAIRIAKPAATKPVEAKPTAPKAPPERKETIAKK